MNFQFLFFSTKLNVKKKKSINSTSFSQLLKIWHFHTWHIRPEHNIGNTELAHVVTDWPVNIWPYCQYPHGLKVDWNRKGGWVNLPQWQHCYICLLWEPLSEALNTKCSDRSLLRLPASISFSFPSGSKFKGLSRYKKHCVLPQHMAGLFLCEFFSVWILLFIWHQLIFHFPKNYYVH